VSWLYGSLSIGFLVGGLVAPIVGRRIDRHGAGAVMVVGSVLSAVTLLAAALAPDGITFTIATVAMQAAASLVLYDAAFAALVQTTGDQARRRITHLTLIAGLASTLFWPLTAWLNTVLGWRDIYVAFAIANLLVCLPIHALIARQHARRTQVVRGVDTGAGAPPDRGLLWLVTIGFALSGFALSAILAQMVPVLVAVGLGSSALVVSAVFGPSQVLVRVINMIAGADRHPILASLVALAMLPAAIIVLLVSGPLPAGAIAFAVLFGFGSGLKSIVQGTLPLALFGSRSYGARLGFMASVRQGLAALAPFVLATLIEWFGATVGLASVAMVGVLGLGCMVVVARSVNRPASPVSIPDPSPPPPDA
jgi:hypothetical protein